MRIEPTSRPEVGARRQLIVITWQVCFGAVPYTVQARLQWHLRSHGGAFTPSAGAQREGLL
jgi:hypothetical protein